MGFLSKLNPVKHVKKAFNSITGRSQKKKAEAAAAEQERKYKVQQANSDQAARKNRQEGADASALPGLGFEADTAPAYGDLSGGLGSTMDGKLKRKKLGGA